jgi:excinuclease ABC subunit C
LQKSGSFGGGPGLILFGDGDRALFVALSHNLPGEFERMRSHSPRLWRALESRARDVEASPDESEDRLLRKYSETLRSRKPEFNILLDEGAEYPHFKLTIKDAFPRLMATRRVRDDGAKYYGPFLPDTGVRRMLDLANRLFKLRSCVIQVDGSFAQPCAEYYSNRCLAPCVASLCGPKEYLEAVADVDRLLSGNLPALLLSVDQRIAEAARDLDFERAAALRDLRETLAPLVTDKRWDLRLDKVSDVFAFRYETGGLALQLETVKAGKIIGEKTFMPAAPPELLEPGAIENDLGSALPQVIAQWYGSYLPEGIFSPVDFPQRRLIAKALSQRAGRKVEIVAAALEQLSPMIRVAARQAELNLQNHFIARENEANALPEIQAAFGLPGAPNRIEAYDVAHLSGQAMVAAVAVAVSGKLERSESRVIVSTETSEISALTGAVKERFVSKAGAPDLILIDGGRAHLNATLKGLAEIGARGVPVVAIVKPPKQRNQISHLIASSDVNRPLSLPPNSPGLRLTQQLRDESHRLANESHRKLREAAQLAETAAGLPGVTDKQRRLLLLNFGSLKNVRNATATELSKFVGEEKAAELRRAFSGGREAFALPTDGASLLVPVRLDDPGGAAEDLRPIRSTDQEGNLLTERATKSKGKRQSLSNPFALKRGRDQEE